MENAQLIALSRQSALRNQLDVVANNMANINTTGFKSQRMLFEEYIMPVAEATEFQVPDRDLSYVHDVGTLTNFEAGSIKTTGNDFDLAVKGEGFFVVQMGDGTQAYTRNGSFHLDNNGQLVTSEGRPVLTDRGPITFSQQDGKIEIAEDGTISTAQGNSGTIRLVNFDNPQQLIQVGDSLFTGGTPVPLTDGKIVQGAIEQSNVQGVEEISRVIEITRAYETISKLMKDTDDLRQSAISALGRLEA